MDVTALSVKKLNKSFGKRKVLSDVTFDCQKGHIVGLIGANGAGKTTIMKIILSLTKSEGQVIVNGQKSNFNDHAILQDVGALVEYPGIYPFLSGRDHLNLFVENKENKRQKVQAVIDELKLTDYIDNKAKNYSLGMKQKLGIAMALINDPDVVILDEPMNGLDPQATKDLREIILNLKKNGTTFLISSHILGELQKIAEDLIVIDHGKIIKKTTMESLLANNHHYLELSTTDDQNAMMILKDQGYQIVVQKPLKIALTESKSVEGVMEILLENQITVRDLKHDDDDLEKSILNLIAE